MIYLSDKKTWLWKNDKGIVVIIKGIEKRRKICNTKKIYKIKLLQDERIC